MSLSRIVLVFLAISPLSFGANKEMLELQRDVAMLQEQVRNMQKEFGDRLVSMQTLTQTTLDGVNRTNNLVNVMENKFNEAMKQQQQSVSVPVSVVGIKLDQMAEDFRAVRESVLDMNTRMGKLDAKMADLTNLINTINRPPAPPPGSQSSTDGVTAPPTPAGSSGPPPGMSADTTYTNAFRDMSGGKADLALQEFSDYLKYFGSTALAPNAQYYIGDIYYRKQDYNKSIEAFDKVLEAYSDNNKTADAHYMKGVCMMALGRNDAAAREFRDVYNRYPDSDLAAKAKARLKDMGLNVGAPAAASKSRRR